MRATHEAVKSGDAADALLLCQHAPTVTVGKRAALGESHVKTPVDALARAGIALARADRGGDATYHGPGQLVAYPVVSLRRAGVGARAYVEGLEASVGDALRGMGIDARGGIKGREGVWVRDGKIAAVGVKISAGTSSHGVAVNVDPDLTHFEHIVPCGLEGYEVTSVVKELGRAVAMEDVETRFIDAFAKRFNYADVFWAEEEES
jgi:lipoyl(octanoyl) transferase